ncbi:hypothetical protein DEA98_18860 [Brucella pseudogrignonensis]|nr:hypothetical protein [Brucella pseudogrignonensis]
MGVLNGWRRDRQNGVGNNFQVSAGDYEDGQVLVRQYDTADNVSENASLGAISVIDIAAADDDATANLGSRTSTTQPPISDESLEVLGLLDTGTPTNGIPVTVAAGSTGDLSITVTQTALIAVADAFNIELYDANGNLVAVATTGNDPLIGDIAGITILGLTSDNTLTANFTGLAPGNYTVVVRKGESALGTLLDADGNGVSLEELGQGGVVLGEENQALVLDAVEDALGPVLGVAVRGVLEVTLGTVDALGAGQLVEVLSTALANLGLTSALDQVLGAVADALLSNTLTLLQDTSVTAILTEHTFANGNAPISGNVIDPDGGVEGEAGQDSVVPGTQVTQVVNSEGDIVEIGPDGATIQGLYGTLILQSDGSYTYTPNGTPESVGQTDTFTYTISDGINTAEANLSVEIDGARLAADTAQAGIEYDYLVTDGIDIPNALSYSWTAVLAGVPVLPTGSLIGQSFEVDANTTQDVTLSINTGSLLALGSGVTVFIDVNTGGNNWVPYATYNTSQLLSLLGIGGNGEILVSGIPEGDYRVRTALNFSVVSVAGSVTVGVESEINHLDEFVQSQVYSANGDLFENDLLNVEPSSLSISTDGIDFTEVLTGGSLTVTGSFGSLLINSDGTYTYTPDDRATFGTSTDTFYYQVEVDGRLEEASLTVAINGTLQGEENFGNPVNIAFELSASDADVIPMHELAPIVNENGDSDADAGETPAQHSLTEGILLDDGSGEVTLPSSNDQSSSDDSATQTSDTGLGTAPVEETASVDDPLGHLVPDPLTQEDDLHTTHTV